MNDPRSNSFQPKIKVNSAQATIEKKPSQKLNIPYMNQNASETIYKPIDLTKNVGDYSSISSSNNSSFTSSQQKLEAYIKKRPFSTSQNNQSQGRRKDSNIVNSYYKNADIIKEQSPVTPYYKNRSSATNKSIKLSLLNKQKNYTNLSNIYKLIL